MYQKSRGVPLGVLKSKIKYDNIEYFKTTSLN